MLKAASHTKLEAGAPLHQLYVQLSTNSVRGASEVSSVTASLAGPSTSEQTVITTDAFSRNSGFACEFVGKVP